MQGLQLPAPTALPMPTPLPLPSPDPQTFGLTLPQAWSPVADYLPPGVQPETAPNYGGTLLERMNMTLTGTAQGVTPGMPLEEAQAQTDRALARISQVNPELAQQLSLQRGDQPEGDEQGFFGKVLQTVASSPLGKALEFISRPARIIPEILTDTDESVWKNIGDALTGRSSATMGDVLAKYDILQGDDLFSKIARGVSSFVLDVAVDPMTYLTMGLGAVGRAGAARLGSKVVMEAKLMEEAGVAALDDVVAKIGRKALGLADDATQEVARKEAFEHLWKAITTSRTSMLKTGKMGALSEELTAVHQDIVGGFLGEALKGAHQETVMQAIRSANEAHKIMGKFGLSRLGPKMAEGLDIPLDNVQAVLNGMKKTGHFASRQEYMIAKQAAAIQGGWRFSVPGIRIITPAMWGTKNADFSIMRRFMSGLSGQHRLMKAVERGVIEPHVARDALEHLTIGGWKRLHEQMPQVTKMFGGPRATLGTAFAQASWQVGSITRNVGSFALVRGGGMGDMLAADARKMVRTVRTSLQRAAMQLEQGDEYDPELIADLLASGSKIDVIGSVSKRGDGVMSQVEVQRTLHALDRAVLASGKEEADLLVIRLLESFPTAEAQQMGADAYFDRLVRNVQMQGLPDDVLEARLKRLDVQRARAKAAEEAAADLPEAHLAARMYRTVNKHTRDSYNELGGHAADSTVRTGAEAVIHPVNRGDVETGHAAQHGKTYVAVHEAEGEYVEGFGVRDVTDTDMGRGTELEEIVDDPAGPPHGYADGETVNMSAEEAARYAEFQGRLEGAGRTPEQMDELRESMKEGYDPTYRRNPDEAEVGPLVMEVNPATGQAVIREGHHRLGVARELGHDVPITIKYVDEIQPNIGANIDEVRDNMDADELDLMGEFGGLQDDVDGSDIGGTLEAPKRRKKSAVVAMKNPLIVNKDAAEKLASGQRPLTGGEVFDPMAEADEFADRTMEMLEEAWNPELEKIRNSKAWREGDGKKYHEQAKLLLREMGLDPEGMTDEMIEIAVSTQESLRARIKTEFLKKKGYDGVITIENGKQRILVFEDGFLTGNKSPIWELSEDAPQFLPDEGYYHRRIEGWVHEAAEGISAKGEKRAPRDWDAHFSRATAGMTFEEAEATIKQMLREMGVEVDEGAQVLDRDVSRNLNAYVDGMANDMGNVFLGREAKRLESLGLTRSPFASDFAGPRYDAVPSQAYMNHGKWLNKHSEKLVKVAEKVARHQQRVARKAEKEMEGVNAALAGLNERLHQATEDEMEKTLRRIAKLGSGNRPVSKETLQRMQDATSPTELRKILAELEGRKPKAEILEGIKGKAAELTEAENLRPGLVEQIKNREMELERLRQKADWHANTMRDVADEWNRLRYAAEARLADPQKAIHIGDPNKAGMGKVLVPGLEGMYMPATMADELNFAARGFKHLNEFQKTWRQFTSFWKEWATWAWPGFHIRNMMGGWFNNWLGGVEFKDYVEVWRAMKARREVELGKEAKWSTTKLDKAFLKRHGLTDYYVGFEPTYEDLATLFTGNGINSASGRSFGEARIGSEMLNREMARPANSPWTLVDTVAGKRTKVGRAGREVARGLRGTGEMTENLLRGAAFLQGMKQFNGDLMAAHSFTMMRHGDYGDLTDWEYGLIRDVIPFYKWMRTNTPLQIHNLLEAPGKLLAVGKAREAVYTGMGIDSEEARGKLPEWMTQGFAIPGPGSSEDALNMVVADLPMNDLYMGAGEFFSSMLPLARPFFENYVTEKSLFSGAPITGKPVKVGWMSGIPGVPSLLQGIGIGSVGPDGEYYIDDKLQNVLGVVPVFSRFRNWVYEEPDRAKLRVGTLVSAVVGISPREFTEGDFADEEINFYYDQILPTMEYLKGIGYPLPTTEDLNAMYGSTNNVLAAAGIPARAGEV